MDNLCAYCFRPEKDCDHCCKGEDCKSYWECSKRPKATIRITTKCTQKCGHCCFDCSPDRKDMMDINTAKDIGKFLVNNNIRTINVMGGEFFCNPDWFDICAALVDGNNLKRVRIVTNSDWAAEEKIVNSIIKFCKKRSNVYIALSKDKWHTNKYVNKAVGILEENNIDYILGNGENNDSDSIVPIGRGKWELGLYSMFATYCSNPEYISSFMIDEVGKIYKCQLGAWDFDDIYNFLEGGFAERFKYFYETFDKVFLGNCKLCIQGYNRYVREKND
jgi:hypothetical protein